MHFNLTLQIGDEFDHFKSDLAMQCLYGGVSYGPQGTEQYTLKSICLRSHLLCFTKENASHAIEVLLPVGFMMSCRYCLAVPFDFRV